MKLRTVGLNGSLMALVCAVVVLGQTHVNETAVLANGQNSDTFILFPPDNAPKDAKPAAGPIADRNGKVLPPQPQAVIEPQSDGTLKVTLTNVFFWGDAR